MNKKEIWMLIEERDKLRRERDEARDLHAKAIEERRSTECEVDAMLERALTAERERDEALAEVEKLIEWARDREGK